MTEQGKKRAAAARQKASALKGRGTHFAAGFMEFIRTQGVIGLAVGLVLGGAVSVVVKSFVDNIIMPPLGLLLGSSDGLKGLVHFVTADGAAADVRGADRGILFRGGVHERDDHRGRVRGVGAAGGIPARGVPGDAEREGG